MTEPAAHRNAISLPDGRFVLPGNRWDLLEGVTPAQPPSVSVVVPHFNAQRQLDRMLIALACQTHPLSRLEVIIADDGSVEPPVVHAPPDLSVRVVSQPDAGFRAAAARNLGAAAASGEVLCFLDADTVPEPGYLQALIRLPALSPDTLVTGRRRHADLAAMTDAAFQAWLIGGAIVGPAPVGGLLAGGELGGGELGPRELPEPQWLRAHHHESGNLARLTPQSYRFVLSAVLGCARSRFTELGGFDETFVRYGGEDWELAHRALCAGAVLAHIPTAVAWHDGASWAERGDTESRRVAKNAETTTLSQLIADPAYGGRPWTGRPDVIVDIETGAEESSAVAVAVRSVLAGRVDAGIWLHGRAGVCAKEEMFSLDPRVSADPVPDEALASARVRVSFSRPLRVDVDAWPSLIARVCANSSATEVGELVLDTGDGVLTVTASRALARAGRWSVVLAERDLVHELFGRVPLDAAENGVTALDRRPELGHELAHLTEPTTPPDGRG